MDLPRETKYHVLDFLPRKDLMTMRLLHSSYLTRSTELLFRQFPCNIRNLEKLVHLGRDPELSLLVEHLTLSTSNPHGAGNKSDVPSLVGHGLDNLSSVEVVPFTEISGGLWDMDAVERHNEDFNVLLSSLAHVSPPKITNFAAKHLDCTAFQSIEDDADLFAPFLDHLTRLKLHFSGLRYRRESVPWNVPMTSEELAFEAKRRICDPVADVVAITSSLHSLSLSFDYLNQTIVRSQPDLEKLFTRKASQKTKILPALRNLSLSGIIADGRYFQKFLLEHKATLRVLRLCNITLMPTAQANAVEEDSTTKISHPSITSFIESLGQYLDLHTVTFAGYMRNASSATGQAIGIAHRPNPKYPYSVDDETEEEEFRLLGLHMLSKRSDGCINSTCNSNCLMVRMQKNVTHSGEQLAPWPLPKEPAGGYIDGHEELGELIPLSDESWGWEETDMGSIGEDNSGDGEYDTGYAETNLFEDKDEFGNEELDDLEDDAAITEVDDFSDEDVAAFKDEAEKGDGEVDIDTAS